MLDICCSSSLVLWQFCYNLCPCLIVWRTTCNYNIRTKTFPTTSNLLSHWPKVFVIILAQILLSWFLLSKTNATNFYHYTARTSHCIHWSLAHSCILDLGGLSLQSHCFFNGILFVHKFPRARPFSVWIGALLLCGSGTGLQQIE